MISAKKLGAKPKVESSQPTQSSPPATNSNVSTGELSVTSTSPTTSTAPQRSVPPLTIPSTPVPPTHSTITGHLVTGGPPAFGQNPMNLLPTGLPSPGSPKTVQQATSLGPDYELMITNLMGLGNWTHQQVVRALRAAYNNPDRAVDYLFNGIPEHLLAQQGGTGGTSGGGTTTTTSGRTTTTTTTGEEERGTTTSNERNTGDQWAPLRQLIQTNPQMVPLLLQHMAQSNPQLVQTLASNPQAMQELLQSLGQSGSSERGSGGGLGSTGTDGGTQPQIPTSIPLTVGEKNL